VGGQRLLFVQQHLALLQHGGALAHQGSECVA